MEESEATARENWCTYIHSSQLCCIVRSRRNNATKHLCFFSFASVSDNLTVVSKRFHVQYRQILRTDRVRCVPLVDGFALVRN